MTLLSPGTETRANVATVDVHAPPCILMHHLLPLPLPSTVIRCLGLAATVGPHRSRYFFDNQDVLPHLPSMHKRWVVVGWHATAAP